MDEKLKAIVNDSFEFTALKKEIEKFDVRIGANTIHIISDGGSHQIEIVSKNFHDRTYTLSFQGNRYTITLENELDFLISEMGLSLGSDAVAHNIYAPMPGLILEVVVVEGQKIKQNEPLCVLEAMKMENSMLAPRDGVVKKIHIAKGESVEKGVLLIELEN